MYSVPHCSVIAPLGDAAARHPLLSHVDALTRLNPSLTALLTASSCRLRTPYVALWKLPPFELFIAYHWIRSLRLTPVFLNSRWSATEVAAVLSSTVSCAAFIVPHSSAIFPLHFISTITTNITNNNGQQIPFLRLAFVSAPEDLGLQPSQLQPRYHLSCSNSNSLPASSLPLPPAPSTSLTHGACDDSQVAGIFFTSGSTAIPKAVPLTDENITVQSATKQRLLHLSPSTIYYHLSPLFHLGGFSSSHAVSLSGGTHVFSLGTSSSSSFAPAKTLRYYKVDVLVGVPSSLILLSQSSEHVRAILYGGNAIPPAVRRNVLKKRWPNARVIGAYGMTETASSITFLDHNSDLLKRPGNYYLHGSAGFPPPHIQLRIDSDGKSDEKGEILVRGPNVFTGYLNAPPLDDDAGGWFGTGDIGYKDKRSGALVVVGRKFDVIKSGGENVYAPEIERHLLSLDLPQIADAAVVGVPHPVFGHVVAAMIHLHRDGIHEEKDMKRFVMGVHEKCDVLAEFKRPRWIVASTNELPKTASGKTMKQKVNELLISLLSDENKALLQLSKSYIDGVQLRHAVVVPRPRGTKTGSMRFSKL